MMRAGWTILWRWLVIGSVVLTSRPLHCEAAEVDGPQHGNTVISVHLPEEQHLRNRGGSDGLGLCVFASIAHAGLYQNVPLAEAIFEYMWSRPGGGYPEKVNRVFTALARERGVVVPAYVQHTGGDEAFLQQALQSGRYPCVTYSGADGVFYHQRVAHMVNLVRFDTDWAVIHDNNYPGRYLWLSPREFLARWRDMGGGWAIVLLHAPPPPIPTTPAAFGESFVHHEADPTLFGVEESKIPRERRYELNGVDSSRQRVFEAMMDRPLNDRDRLAVTVVGDATTRSRIERDWQQHPRLLDWQKRCHFQSYPLDHWMVRTIGLQPGVTIQGIPDADGRAAVLARLRQYEEGDALVLAEALRRADPNYRPDLDVDPHQQPALNDSGWPMLQLREIIGMVLAILLIGFRDHLLRYGEQLLRPGPRIRAEDREAFRRWIEEQKTKR